jgi:hypothetical protein
MIELGWHRGLRSRAKRRLFASSWPMLASRGGAQIIYSAAVGRHSAPHAGVISPDFLLPLGYEQSEASLRCLMQSPVVALACANVISPGLASRTVSSFTPCSGRLVHKSVHDLRQLCDGQDQISPGSASGVRAQCMTPTLSTSGVRR